jgi:predicted AlkP superfamily pyrophosphatase or phosphodiesterase
MSEQGAAAEGMRVVNPAVTWPNHTSMVTGVVPAVHSVLYNGVAVREGDGMPLRIEPWIDKNEMVLAPTVSNHASRRDLDPRRHSSAEQASPEPAPVPPAHHGLSSASLWS